MDRERQEQESRERIAAADNMARVERAALELRTERWQTALGIGIALAVAAAVIGLAWIIWQDSEVGAMARDPAIARSKVSALNVDSDNQSVSRLSMPHHAPEGLGRPSASTSHSASGPCA